MQDQGRRSSSGGAQEKQKQQARQSASAKIVEFFSANLGQCFPTSELHWKFGSGFRTRVSELNRDPDCLIRIFNDTTPGRNENGQPCEKSVYWAELRASTLPLFAGVRS